MKNIEDQLNSKEFDEMLEWQGINTEKPREEYISKNSKNRQERSKVTAEIFTPPWLVNEMLDKLPLEIWEENNRNTAEKLAWGLSATRKRKIESKSVRLNCEFNKMFFQNFLYRGSFLNEPDSSSFVTAISTHSER